MTRTRVTSRSWWRQAAAILRALESSGIPIARLRRAPTTCGPVPVRIWEASFAVGDIADVMEDLDVPVAADPFRELGGYSLEASGLVIA